MSPSTTWLQVSEKFGIKTILIHRINIKILKFDNFDVIIINHFSFYFTLFFE